MSAAGRFFLSAYAWNVALGLTQILVPLYSYHLGMSGLAIGSLISAPIVLQIVLRFAGAVAAERWGERNILAWTYSTMALAGVAFFFAHDYVSLLLAQMLSIMSRATYFASAQALATRLPGKENIHLGRLVAANQGGVIGGTVAAGVLVSWVGFNGSFLVLVIAGLIALASCLSIPPQLGAEKDGPNKPAGTLRGVFRERSMYFAIVCSFVAALPISLGQSFLPVFLAERNFTTDVMGPVLSVRPLGAVIAGLLLARFVTKDKRLPLAVVTVSVVGLTIGIIPFLGGALPLTIVLLGLGTAAGLANVTYQTVAGEAGATTGRALAMALGGVGLNLSTLLTPMFFGLFSDLFSLPYAFHLCGALVLLLAGAITPLYRWTFPAGGPGTVETSTDAGRKVPS